MKSCEFYLAFLTTALFYSGSYGGSNPMVLFYYPDEETYVLSDVYSANHRDLDVDANGKPFVVGTPYTKMIFLCPTTNHTPSADVKYLEIQTIQPASDVYLEGKPCDYVSTYGRVPVSIDKNEHGAYTISYLVRNDEETKKILRDKGLGDTKFPNVDTYEVPLLSQIYIAWFDFSVDRLALTRSQHRMNARNKQEIRPRCYDSIYKTTEGIRQQDIYPYYDQANEENLRKEYAFPEGSEFFVKHNFVPIDDFTDQFSRLATCTYLNIVPVWRSVSEQSMRRVEWFIQLAGSRLPVDTLGITTIAHDILMLPTKNTLFRSQFKRKQKPVFLDSENDKDERESTSVDNLHSIAIVIHNETGGNVEKVCGKGEENDYCVQNGWHVTDGGNDERVYCCDLNDEFFTEYSDERKGTRNLPLDLNKIYPKEENIEGNGSETISIADQLKNYKMK